MIALEHVTLNGDVSGERVTVELREPPVRLA
jgi:hypothetical protein